MHHLERPVAHSASLPVEVLCVGDCVYNEMGVPPIQIGGPPAEVGSGRTGPATAGTCSPPGHVVPPRSARSARTVSTRCSRRTSGPSVGIPYTSCSAWLIRSPVPIASTKRPDETSSSDTTCFARSPADRREARVTSVPTVTLSVTEATAANLLAMLLEGGFGVARDPKQALMWYEKAAEQDETNSMMRLANAYMEGMESENSSVEKNPALALKWFAKAAELLSRAQSIKPQANVAAFLLSDEASHVTGQSWAVDGGVQLADVVAHLGDYRCGTG